MAGGDEKARIDVELAGVAKVAADQKQIADGWAPVADAQKKVADGATKVDKAWSGLKSGIKSLAGDALRATQILQGISLAKGVDEARAMQQQVARFSMKTGESAQAVATKLDGLERRTLTSAPAMMGFAASLQSVTYDSQFATGSLGELGDIALSMGETLGEQLNFAETMRNGLGVTEQLTAEFDRLRGMAEELNLAGGIQAFRDTLVAAAGELQNVAINSDQARQKVLGLAAALSEGLKPGQAKTVVSGALSMMRNRANDLERVLGRDVLDKHGNLIDPSATMGQLKDYALKRQKEKGWSDRTLRQSLRAEFGVDLGSAIYSYDPKKAAQLGNRDAALNPSGATEARADAARASEGGKAIAGQLDRDQQLRHAGEVLLSASNKFHEVVGVWGALGTQIASQLGGGLFSSLLEGTGAAAVAGKAVSAGQAALAYGSQLGGSLLTGAGAGIASIGGVAATALGQLYAVSQLGEDSDTTGANWRSSHAQTLGAELAQQAIQAGDLQAVIGKAGNDEGVIKALLEALEKRQNETNGLLAQQIASAIAEVLHRAPLQVRMPSDPNKRTQ